MARRIRRVGQQLIEADNGIGWERERASAVSVSSGRYVTEIFGISYELEKRRRNARVEPGTDTGWYLYSRNDTYFFGEFCGSRLMEAVDEASEMIIKSDLRGPGYGREETR
jgi:hypothetical protein